MQALGAEQRGDALEVLQHVQLPELTPQDLEKTDVLIKVAYSDLNPVDLQKLAKGPAIGDTPFVPGYGGSGIVEQVGSSAPKTLVGKAVCFLADPSRPYGSYASHIVVDHRCVAPFPSSKNHNIELRDAASIPIAGVTAYECLMKLGLASDHKVSSQSFLSKNLSTSRAGELETVGLSSSARDQNLTTITNAQVDKSMLIVGGSGGVGSWLLTLAKAWHPNMKLTVTTGGSAESNEWCKALGANQVIGHHEINQALKGGPAGSVDYIVCLTEPTPSVFNALTEVVRPYGKIVLVVAEKGIETLNLGFAFFKCADVYTETVFSSIRTKYASIVPRDEMSAILGLMASQTIRAPLSPALTVDESSVSEKLSDALKDNGILKLLKSNSSKQGKLVMMIHAGNGIIFLDLKTASIFSIPRKECIAKHILTVSKKNPQEWDEQSQIIEKQQIVRKITTHPKLGIVKVAEKQVCDYEDGLDMEEAEKVKSMWGVQLKKRVKNAEGEELLFVDLRTSAVGELSRKKCVELGAFAIGKDSEGHEIVEEAVTDANQRDDLVTSLRQALKITLEAS